MTELACHQLEVCNWAAKRMPVSIIGMGDIVYWKDGREVYDSVNVTYRYSDGTKIAYESLISNKFNGMEDQILGHKGTMEMAKGIYYLEEDHSTSGIRQLIGQVKDKVFAAIPTAGPSWRPETKMEYTPHFVIEGDLTSTRAEHDRSRQRWFRYHSLFFLPIMYHWRKSTNVVERSLLLHRTLPAWQSSNGGRATYPFPRRI